MSSEAFDKTLLSLKRRTPFRPFEIALINGDRVEVDRSDAIAVRDGVGVYAGSGGVPAIFDHEGVNQIISDPM